jgi:ABC-type transport system involved in cytochrome c biogenesis permease subunit
MTQNGAEDSAAKAPERTGLAIATALIAAIAFNFAYSMLFGSLASLLAGNAGDDSLWGAGISALVAFATNFLSCLSAAAVAKRLFPRANFMQMFYAFVALLLFGGVAIALRESMDPAGSILVVVGIYAVIIAVTISGLWVYLRPRR